MEELKSIMEKVVVSLDTEFIENKTEHKKYIFKVIGKFSTTIHNG